MQSVIDLLSEYIRSSGGQFSIEIVGLIVLGFFLYDIRKDLYNIRKDLKNHITDTTKEIKELKLEHREQVKKQDDQFKRQDEQFKRQEGRIDQIYTHLINKKKEK